MALAGVNSINWARIVAQVTYYFVAAAALGAPHRPVTFSVPTGNFGDIFAGWVAKRMGLPVERLVIASNANDILPRTYAEGVYEMRGVVATSSPSMDIQISSNFERYLFEASSRDAAQVRAAMGALAQGGRFEMRRILPEFHEEFSAASASESEAQAAIRRVRKDSGYLMDPHTACAWVADEKCIDQTETPRVILATAHPAKFPDGMERIIGERPRLPERYGALLTDKERFPVLANDLAAVEAHVASVARAVSEGAA
jgi:threonine synthase